MPATGIHSIEDGRAFARTARLVRPYPFCELQDKWHGVDCPTQWPVSRMVWCSACRDFEAGR